MTNVLDLFFTMVGDTVTVLSTVQLLGIPFLYFVIGFMLIGLVMKFILK